MATDDRLGDDAPVREAYTSYPRPVLWLVPEGELALPAALGEESARGSVSVAPFYLSTLPVTNRQLEAFDPSFRRSPGAPGDDDPAVGVSHGDALAYCAWYGRLARKAIRLPDEREWEHACRAGAEWPGNAAAADSIWHRGNSGECVPQLAAKPSNGFGIFAMLGGVWEWVEPAAAGSRPLLRGGSWRTPLEEILAGARRQADPGKRPADAGFRIAKSLRG